MWQNENEIMYLPGKCAFISLNELSNYYFSRSFVARKIKYLEFISGNKVALFSRLINSYLDTPSAICDCGCGKEDTIHFFTECALFATTRTNLMRSISNILTHNNLEHLSHAQLTLYGHSNLGKTLNCLVLQASIKVHLWYQAIYKILSDFT